MRIIPMAILCLLLTGCSGSGGGFTLTIKKIGDGVVFPYEGTRNVSGDVPIVAFEHYGSYQFARYEGADSKHSTDRGSIFRSNVNVNKNRTVTVVFEKRKLDLRWLTSEVRVDRSKFSTRR